MSDNKEKAVSARLAGLLDNANQLKRYMHESEPIRPAVSSIIEKARYLGTRSSEIAANDNLRHKIIGRRLVIGGGLKTCPTKLDAITIDKDAQKNRKNMEDINADLCWVSERLRPLTPASRPGSRSRQSAFTLQSDMSRLGISSSGPAAAIERGRSSVQTRPQSSERAPDIRARSLSRNSRRVEYCLETILFKVREYNHVGYAPLEAKIARWNRPADLGRVSANALAFGVLQSLAERDATRMNNAAWLRGFTYFEHSFTPPLQALDNKLADLLQKVTAMQSAKPIYNDAQVTIKSIRNRLRHREPPSIDIANANMDKTLDEWLDAGMLNDSVRTLLNLVDRSVP